MALLISEGFDHANYLAKWLGTCNWTAPSTTYARRSNSRGAYITNSTYLYRYLGSNCTTVMCGIGIYLSSVGSGAYTDVFSFTDGTYTQIRLQCINSSGTYQFRVINGNGTVLGTWNLNSNIVTGTWNYYELKVTFGTSGSFELKVNEQTAVSGTGVQTKHSSSSNDYASYVYINTNWSSANIYLDDVYICNDSGSYNNDFLGDTRIDYCVPNGAGNYTEWTPSTGSNYSCVDEILSNQTDYVSTGTLDNIDTYTYSDLPVESVTPITNLECVIHNVYATRASAGTPVKIKSVCRIGGTDYLSTEEFALIDSWYTYQFHWELNPATSSIWTKTDVDSAEFGYQLTAIS